MGRSKGTGARKARVGIALDPKVVEALDTVVRNLVEFGLTRSEVVDAILKRFLESNPDPQLKTMELVAKARSGRL